jgi:hypothetical protein
VPAVPDLTRETLILLAEAPAHFPPTRPGKKVHVLSVRRWARAGAGGVRLETVDLGSRVYTSVEAVGRFLRARAARRRKGMPAHLRERLDRLQAPRHGTAYRQAARRVAAWVPKRSRGEATA